MGYPISSCIYPLREYEVKVPHIPLYMPFKGLYNVIPYRVYVGGYRVPHSLIPY